MVKGIRLSSWVVEDSEDQEAELTRFVRVAKKKIRCGEYQWMEDMLDPRLEGQFSRNQAAKMVEIGVSCVEEDRSKRPTMGSVIGTRASPGLKHFSKPPMEVVKFLLLLLFAATVDWSEAGLPSLWQGSSLKVEEEIDFLVSPNGTFSRGFYEVGTNASCYSIWFSKSVNKTVVWMANIDRSVSGRGSKLTLQRINLNYIND
ncbi:hypothetical protein ACE6H2_021599 [Prunus campanulata]